MTEQQDNINSFEENMRQTLEIVHLRIAHSKRFACENFVLSLRFAKLRFLNKLIPSLDIESQVAVNLLEISLVI